MEQPARWSGVGKPYTGEWEKVPEVRDAWFVHLQSQEGHGLRFF